MSAPASSSVDGYDARSLRHERRMISIYRRDAQNDGGLLQPLANACRRAASFEWILFRDVNAVRRLWAEAARTLAAGFTQRRPGFDPSPDQLILALHLSIAAKDRDSFTSLSQICPDRAGALREARAFRASRAHFHLAEGYTLIARSLVERRREPARAAVQSLDAARRTSDRGWWEQQFPEPLEAAWRLCEHEALCALLSAVAQVLADEPGRGNERARVAKINLAADEISAIVDDTLLLLDRFIASDINHHPKLYCWLPGLALCTLAATAGLPMQWLLERHASRAPGYERLPLDLLRNVAVPE